jgi:hypothetical protein
MGKAKKQLDKARSQFFHEITSRYDKGLDENEDESDSDDEPALSQRRIDVAQEIHKRLVSYCVRQAFPLCEYLTLDDVLDFVHT